MRWILFAASLPCLAQAPAAIQVEVSEVTVSVSVADRDGAPVADLRREAFTILDSGQPREVRSFWRETDLPLTIGLIADVSGSQVGVIGKHRETLRRFLEQVMGPRDNAFLVTVGNHDIKLVTDLTGSVDALLAGVDGVERRQAAGATLAEGCQPRRHTFRNPFGACGTPLWDGVYAVARLKMKELAGRKALIVISDGQDVGSGHTVTDAIEAAQSADTLVYTMRYLSPIQQFHPLMRLRAAFRKGMQNLSDETGGKAYPSPDDPDAIFAEIENDLRNIYVLGFAPPEEARNGKFRKLEIKVAVPNARVRARRGYTVPTLRTESN